MRHNLQKRQEIGRIHEMSNQDVQQGVRPFCQFFNGKSRCHGADNGFFAFEPSTMGQNNFEILMAKEPTIEETVGNGFDYQYKLYGAMIHEVFRTEAGAVFDAITDIGT